MSHLGHRHHQPPQYELGHVHHLLLLKSETAKQLLSYKYIAVKISMYVIKADYSKSKVTKAQHSV